MAFPDVSLLLQELKENVVEEEKVVAQEEFKFRDMNTDESYSEYKMALFALAGVGYEEYDEDQLSAKVLERFLSGCGAAGQSVRLQAPKTLEEAITKAIAYDNEQTRTGKATVYQTGQQGQQENVYWMGTITTGETTTMADHNNNSNNEGSMGTALSAAKGITGL